MPVHVCVCLIDMYTCACDCRYTSVCRSQRLASDPLSLPPHFPPYRLSKLSYLELTSSARLQDVQAPGVLLSHKCVDAGAGIWTPNLTLAGKCCTSRLISHPLLLRYDFRKSKGKEAKPGKAKKFSHRVRFRAGGRISCGKINSLHCSSDLYLFLLTRISSKKFPLPPLTFMILLMLEPPPPYTHIDLSKALTGEIA